MGHSETKAVNQKPIANQNTNQPTTLQLVLPCLLACLEKTKQLQLAGAFLTCLFYYWQAGTRNLVVDRACWLVSWGAGVLHGELGSWLEGELSIASAGPTPESV